MLANLAREALLHAPLVGRPGVLDTERHGHVAEGAEWRDEHCLILILDRHIDLVITRVSVEEAQ